MCRERGVRSRRFGTGRCSDPCASVSVHCTTPALPSPGSSLDGSRPLHQWSQRRHRERHHGAADDATAATTDGVPDCRQDPPSGVSEESTDIETAVRAVSTCVCVCVCVLRTKNVCGRNEAED